MKYLISFIAFVVSLQIFSICSYAQQYEDIVYLKNGSIIHGTIIEQIPGESIKIKSKDGNLFVFKMDEIEKMTKEEVIIKKDTIKKVVKDSIKTKDKSNKIQSPVKELIAKNSITFQPIGLFLLLTNIEVDRAISKNFSAGLKISFMTFLIRNALKFEGNKSDVDNAEAMKESISAWGIGGHIRYYPGDRAVEGFFLGLALENLSGKFDEVKTKDTVKTTTHYEAGLTRFEFEIGSKNKLGSGKGGVTITWSFGVGAGFWSKGSDSGVVPVGSIGFGLGYSF